MVDTVAKIVLTAEDKTAAAMASLRNGLSSIETRATSLRGVFGALVPAASFTGLAAAFKTINDGVDALNDLKDATGSSIENISALEDVAARTGTSFDTVGTALIKFNQILNEAKPNTDAAAALKAIGLEAEALKQIDPAEALRVTAVALGQFADDGNKARVVQELFGKSLREVAPLLNDLKEQGALLAKVTTKQAEEAEKLNRQLFELQKNAKDTSRVIVAELVPAINRMLANYLQLREQGLLGTVLADAAKELVGLGQLTDNAGADINRLIALRDKLQEKGRKSGFTSSIKDEIEEVNNLLAVSRIRQASQIDLGGQFSDAVSRRTTPRPSLDYKNNTKSEAEKIDEQRTSLAAFVRQQQAQLDNTEKLTETQQALNFLASQGVQGQIPQVRELVLGLAERVDQEKKIAAVLAEQNRLQKEMDDAYRSRLQGMLESGPAARLEKTREDIQLLTAEFEEGRISEEQYLDAVTGRLNLVADGVKEASDNAREFGFIFNSAFEDAIINGKDLSEVIQALGQDIARMAIRKSVTEPLGNAVGSFLSDLNFADIFGFANGGIMTPSGPIPLHSYANGGIATSPQLALFGEGRMNEAFVPLPDGRSIPVSLRGGAGSQPIMQTFNFNGPADRAQVITAAQLGAAMAREQRIDDRNRGRY